MPELMYMWMFRSFYSDVNVDQTEKVVVCRIHDTLELNQRHEKLKSEKLETLALFLQEKKCIRLSITCTLGT